MIFFYIRSPGPASMSPIMNSMMPTMEEMLRKSNLIPFGDVTVSNHPNSAPIPMTLPMVYLVPLSRDETSGEVKYKMLIPRNGPEMIPPFFPLQSPPLLPNLNQRFSQNFPADEHTDHSKKSSKPATKTQNGNHSSSSSGALKVETSEADTPSAPLDLTHRSPTSSGSEDHDDKKEEASKSSTSSENNIEEHLTFLKVKQMEFLKQAAESAQNRCNECNINFSKYQNYVAHKKYYCSGLKQQQSQDSDDESPSPATQTTSAPGKKQTPLPSPTSPPFSQTSPNVALQKQNLFNQDFFLNQKSMMENFPGKIPLLMTPPVMNMTQPNASHFVCQGCGIKFKSISNLKAHQSRYCSGIKNSEDQSHSPPAVNPNLEALLKTQMAAAGAAGGLPLQGLSAADMITLLSAQHMAAVKNMEQEKKSSQSPPAASTTTPTRGKSPKGSSESGAPVSPSPAAVPGVTGVKPENKDDFCLVLCGFKESSVDINKLKEQFNMQFIGQVKKRKSDSEHDDENDESDDTGIVAENSEEPINKRVKKEDNNPEEDIVIKTPQSNVEPKHDSGKENTMKCGNCNISFVNATTFKAHVNFYCKNRVAGQD